MKIRAECVPCLLGRVLYETNLVAPEKGLEVMADACAILGRRINPECVSSEVATEVHAAAYRRVGPDPYRELKNNANRTVLEMLPAILERAEKEEDRFRFLTLCAIAANTLDFGIKGGLRDVDTLKTRFWDIVGLGLGVDHTDKIKNLIPGGKLLYFTDNCGEIVLDRTLIAEIRKMKPEYIGVVVKGVPVLSDATMEDALELRFDELVDEILTTNGFAVGVNVHDFGGKLEARLRTATLVIAKGMANFEALSETRIKPIAYLLRAKCPPVAESIGARVGDNVAKLIE
ncbi:MAG: ARMT1-like domain-containing protein [Thermoplasmata archaeon]|nr:ARMT1-like domain-containing protein [Thermoplasmata archaeon]